MRSTYRDIFLSTGLVGLQQGVRLAVGIVQSKIVAVLLGATGTGSFGVYASFLNLAQSVFGLGLYGSGVRQIAAASRTEAPGLSERPIRTLLGLHAGLAVLGGIATVLLRRQISRWIFGDDRSAAAIGVLGIALAAAMPGAGAMAVLQGLRRLRALTAAIILGAVSGAAAAIGLVYRYREAGIAPAFLGSAACATLAAVLFLPPMRRRTHRPFREAARDAAGLVRLGAGFMAVSMLGALSAFGVRALIVRRLGLEPTGYYHAAAMLGGFYATALAQAMGTDFLPRISACADRRDEFNRHVNEQIESGLVLTLPGILLCLAGAPLLLRSLYTAEFAAAVGAARWMLAAGLVRAAAWPLNFVPVALNRPGWMAVSEAVHATALFACTALGVRGFGLAGAGMACLAAATALAAVQWFIARRLTALSFSARVRRLSAVLGVAAAVAFALAPAARLPVWTLWGWTGLTVIGCAGYALHLLRRRSPADGSSPR